MKFPPWWGSGYFLELHDCLSSVRLKNTITLETDKFLIVFDLSEIYMTLVVSSK